MGDRLWLHTVSHLRFYRRSWIVLGFGLGILGLWSLTLIPLFYMGSTSDRFNQLEALARQLAMLGWFLSAGLGLFVTSSHLRNRSVQVVLTRPGSPQIWLASVFLSALIVAAATQAVGAIVTFLLSLAWDVPYQIGFLYIALDAVFEAAIVVAILTTLGAVMHPILAVLAALLFNEGTFYSLRYGLELLSFQGHGGGFIAALKPIVTAIHVALPMLDPFSEQTRTVAMSLRVSGADWAYLLATAAYSAGVILVCFLLADVALRRRSFASTA